MYFFNKFKPFYKGLKTTTNTMAINKTVGISFINLKNFDDLELSPLEKSLKCLPK